LVEDGPLRQGGKEGEEAGVKKNKKGDQDFTKKRNGRPQARIVLAYESNIKGQGEGKKKK